MASQVRLQIAKQLADAVHGVPGSTTPDLSRLSWCVRCALFPRKSRSKSNGQTTAGNDTKSSSPTQRQQFIVPYRNLQACSIIPEDLPRKEHKNWATKVSKNLKCLDGLKSVEVNDYNLVLEYEQNEFAKNILNDVWLSKENYGRNSIMHKYRASKDATLVECPQGETVLVEFSSPNIAKPFHAGHLRSTIVGNFVANINEALSHKTVRVNYLGDWGTQFGILGVGYQKYGGRTTSSDKDALQSLFDVYVKINKDMLDNDDIHKEGMAFFKRMEEGNIVAISLWQYCRDSSIQEYRQVYDRLGVKFDHYEGESQYRHKAHDVVKDLTNAGLLQRRDGSNVGYMDLPSDKQSGFHANMIKSDGTTLYITRDVAAAVDRQSRFKFDRVHYVVGNDQNLHFQQLVSVLKKMGYVWADKCADEWHVKFGRLDGMSTRRGEVVFLSDILDEAQACMLEKMNSTGTTQVMENQEVTADRLGVSAIIIQGLKERRLHNYKFSWQRTLSFNGDSGVSLQYAHARLSSLERRCGTQLNPECDVSLLMEPSAMALVLHLARYDECLQACYLDLQSHYLTTYLFQLRHLVNASLLDLQVKGQSRDLAEARLFLLHCARLTLANGLRVLGVTPLKRM